MPAGDQQVLSQAKPRTAERGHARRTVVNILREEDRENVLLVRNAQVAWNARLHNDSCYPKAVAV